MTPSLIFPPSTLRPVHEDDTALKLELNMKAIPNNKKTSLALN